MNSFFVRATGCALVMFGVWGGEVFADDAPVSAEAVGGTLIAATSGGEVLVELASGKELKIPIPARTELTSLAALGTDEWVMAGSFESEDGRRRLLVLSGDEQTGSRMLVPPGQKSRTRRGPQLLVEDGALRGIAWLEGNEPTSLGVFSSRWTGKAWTEPERIAAPGPGSQLSLSGAVLRDGSWLLVWSAFDGKDDEILWSRRLGSGWLPPARLHPENRVPDITPSVTVGASGALVAWGQYDGTEYRLQMARFRRGGWTDAEAVGEPGSLYPTFSTRNGRTCLLYLKAQPRSWSVAELDGEGSVLRRGSTPFVLNARPVAAFTSDGSVELRWPRRDTVKALHWSPKR